MHGVRDIDADVDALCSVSYKENQKHVELVIRNQHSRDQEPVLMNVDAYDTTDKLLLIDTTLGASRLRRLRMLTTPAPVWQ